MVAVPDRHRASAQVLLGRAATSPGCISRLRRRGAERLVGRRTVRVPAPVAPRRPGVAAPVRARRNGCARRRLRGRRRWGPASVPLSPGAGGRRQCDRRPPDRGLRHLRADERRRERGHHGEAVGQHVHLRTAPPSASTGSAARPRAPCTSSPRRPTASGWPAASCSTPAAPSPRPPPPSSAPPGSSPTWPTGRSTRRKLLGVDADSGAAVRAASAPSPLAASSGWASTLAMGDTVHTGGASGPTARVDALGVNASTDSGQVLKHLVRLDIDDDAPIAEGTPLLDSHERVVGLCTHGRDDRMYAVPIEIPRAAARSINVHGRVVVPWLGVSGDDGGGTTDGRGRREGDRRVAGQCRRAPAGRHHHLDGRPAHRFDGRCWRCRFATTTPAPWSTSPTCATATSATRRPCWSSDPRTPESSSAGPAPLRPPPTRLRLDNRCSPGTALHCGAGDLSGARRGPGAPAAAPAARSPHRARRRPPRPRPAPAPACASG